METFVLRLLRDRGMSLQDICTAVRKVRRAIGSEYALASKRITTDGVDVIIDVSRRSNVREWVRARDDQGAFREVIERYLLNIEFDIDGIARRLTLPTYEGADVIVDPRFGLGQPVLAQQKVRVQDLVDAWWGGDRLDRPRRPPWARRAHQGRAHRPQGRPAPRSSRLTRRSSACRPGDPR